MPQFAMLVWDRQANESSRMPTVRWAISTRARSIRRPGVRRSCGAT